MSQPVSRNGRESAAQAAWISNLLLTLPFLLLYWLDLYHHQSWFDEVNAWGISAASPNLHTLFHLVHYEGHPWLWYFLLYWPSRLTHDPNAMKWVVALFGTGVYLTLGLLAPFTPLQKVLLFLSYFVSYEYTVTLRMYVIMFFLALLYAWRRSARPQAVFVNLCILALMTNVDMTAVLLSGALLLEYLYSLLLAPDRDRVPRERIQTPLVGGLLVYAALLALSLVSLWPAKDISWQTGGHIGAHLRELRPTGINLANVIAGPWWPINHEFPVRFWDTDAHLSHVLFLLSPLVLFCYWRALRGRRNLLLLVFSALVIAYVWADAVYVGHVRHWGIVYICFVIALWLRAAEAKGTEFGSTRWSPWTYGLIGLSAVAGVVAVISSWMHPLTQADAAAAWIRTHEPAGQLITGQPDDSFISVAQRLQRPVYMMECNCVDTFKLFSRAHDDFPNEQLGAHLNTALNTLHRQSILFVFWEPLSPEMKQDLREHDLVATPLAAFDGADLRLENYHLFRVSRPEAEGDTPPPGHP